VCPSNVKVVVIVYVKLKNKKIFHFKYNMMYTMRMINIMWYFKDDRSVSLYPYNRSQILHYVKYTNEITLPKELQKNVKMCFGQIVKTQQ